MSTDQQLLGEIKNEVKTCSVNISNLEKKLDKITEDQEKRIRILETFRNRVRGTITAIMVVVGPATTAWVLKWF